MLAACKAALPADAAVMAAAVADWRVADVAVQKIKKGSEAKAPTLTLVPNPDILAALSEPGALRPKLVVGFAAETENVDQHAQATGMHKGCDWIVAIDVSLTADVMGGEEHLVHHITGAGVERWPRLAITK